MDKEIWKIYRITRKKNNTIRDIYEVSNMGRIKKNGEVFEPSLQYRYYRCGRFKVHRAVAELFIPNPDNKPYIDHINTNTLDNRACNLRWVTQKENCNNQISKMHYSSAKKDKHWKVVDGKRVWY